MERTFLKLPIFFPLLRSFLPVSEKVWNRIVFFKSFMRSSWSSAFEECSLENTDQIFCQKSKKFWFKTRWTAPTLEQKKFFSIGKFSSKRSFGHVKHVNVRFVEHADIFWPKITLLLTNVQNSSKPTDYFWKVISSTCFSVYVEGCVNCAVENSLQKSEGFPIINDWYWICFLNNFAQTICVVL